MIGAGGGFLLVPILIYLYPAYSHQQITGMSMMLVAFNSTSGSLAYLYKRLVHLPAARAFILASLPGAVMGVYCGKFVNRNLFELIFGVALILYAIFMILKKAPNSPLTDMRSDSPISRNIYIKGMLISFFVGFLASFLGIGGGIIHVPLLVHMLAFPVHMAAGTSHFILAFTSWTALSSHLYQGDVSIFNPIVLSLCIGAVVGAQGGAYLSKFVKGQTILRVLGLALLIVGSRLILRYFQSL